MAHSDIIAPPARPRGAALARVADVLLDPVAAFRGVAINPTWGVAFLALVAVRFGSVLAFYRPDTTPAKLVAGVLFQLLMAFPLVCLTAVLLWALALAWRCGLTWAGAWCVTTHVHFAYTLVTVAIASVAGALTPDTMDVDLRNPPFTNLAFLVSSGDSSVLHALAREADVRSLYASVLAWMGVRGATNAAPKKAAGVVATYVAIAVTLAVATAAFR
jgi:hypothetical protein